jgi:hypothetical protein
MLKGLFKLLGCKDINEASINGSKPVIYQSPLPKQERYNEILKFHQNRSYFSPWMLDFADKYVIPRFYLNGWLNKYLGHMDPLTDFAFSTGVRESRMIENATTHLLVNKYKLSLAQINKYYIHRSAIEFGYPLDLMYEGDLQYDVRFRRTIIFSYDDLLSIMPLSFMTEYIISGLKPKENSYTVFHEPYTSKSEEGNTLIIIGRNAVKHKDIDQAKFFGHSFQHYISDTINILPPSLLNNITMDLYPDSYMPNNKSNSYGKNSNIR